MQPPWFQLLCEQQYGQGITAAGRAPGNRVGLTPAFVVGAMRTPPGAVHDAATSRAELSSLLESMRDNSSGKSVTIAECGNLLQPRVSLSDGAVGHLGNPVLLPNGSPSKLYASPQYFARDTRDVESLADGLWKLLGPAICEGHFSRRTDTWQEFSVDDLEFIERALNDRDDT
jgi:hypothetical protein